MKFHVTGGDVGVIVEGAGVSSGVRLDVGADVGLNENGNQVNVVDEGGGVCSGVTPAVGAAVEFNVTGGEVGGVIEAAVVFADVPPIVLVRYSASTTTPTTTTSAITLTPIEIAPHRGLLSTTSFGCSASACLGSSGSSWSCIG